MIPYYLDMNGTLKGKGSKFSRLMFRLVGRSIRTQLELIWWNGHTEGKRLVKEALASQLVATEPMPYINEGRIFWEAAKRRADKESTR